MLVMRLSRYGVSLLTGLPVRLLDIGSGEIEKPKHRLTLSKYVELGPGDLENVKSCISEDDLVPQENWTKPLAQWIFIG